MKSIFTILQDIEKLIYKVLMWVILVPKTIVKITLDPAWAPGYVKDEMEHDESPFDEYISPVILLLVVALIPALAFNFLPSYGVTISTPAETQPTTDRFLAFESITDFRSTSSEMEYFQSWTVNKIKEDGTTEQTYLELHHPNSPVNFIDAADNNTAQDQFLYTFVDSGEYFVSVISGKYEPRRFDPERGIGVPTETYTTSLKVIVPLILDEQIVIANENSLIAVVATKKQGFDTFTAQVQKENTIFLALALMMPPLLFAFATKFFKETIGENTLKEDFYIQCYYFSPLSLAIWGSYYARYFFTADAYFYGENTITLPIVWLPPLLAALWFIRAEVKTIANARGISEIKSLVISLVCIALLGLAANIIFAYSDFQDDVRLTAIRIFPLASAALIAAFGLAWYRRRRARNANVTSWNIVWMGVNAVILVGLLNFISLRFASGTTLQVVSQTRAVDTPTTLATGTATPQILVLENTPTPEPTSVLVIESPTPVPQPFYTEEFNTDIANWISFMTSGDERMVERSVDLGKLSINLLQLEDKLPRYYLINDSFTYSNVKVEAVVTNRGVNANGVSLICRYSDIGWYEFRVSNSGYYSVFAVDIRGIISQGYNEIATGGVSEIKSGLETNVYTAVCNGNELSLFINQSKVQTISDEKFNLSEGKIGLAVSSPEKLPVAVDFDTLVVSEP